MKKNEEYKGFQIYYYSDWNNEISGFTFSATVYDKSAKDDKDFLFFEKSQISTMALRIKYSALISEAAEQEISEKTIARVLTRIDLGIYNKGNEYFESITSENVNEFNIPMDDETVRDYLLKGLFHLRKTNPLAYTIQSFNPAGFCGILRISTDTYIFNASLLMEEGLIESKFDHGIEFGQLYITSSGASVISEKMKKDDFKRITNTVSNSEEKKYDIAISFAGEDREIAEKLAQKLIEKQISVFYDNFEKADLWGKNLYDYLSAIYSEKSKFCVMILSKFYEKKLWTNHERRSAQARAFRENREYILPIRIDNTKISGLQETVGYIDINSHSIDEIVDLILEKLKKL